MKKITQLFVLSAMLLATMSCTTASFSGLQMTKEMPAHQVVGDFEVTVKITEYLGAPGGANLGNITAEAMNSVVSDAIQMEISNYDGDAAIDIDIVQKATFVDVLLTSVTGSIYAPCHVTISGTVIKYAN